MTKGTGDDLAARFKPAAMLKAARERRNISQAELARLVGVTQSAIGKLELGNRRLTLDWAVRLARALRCDVSEILPTPDAVTKAVAESAASSIKTKVDEETPTEDKPERNGVPVFVTQSSWRQEYPVIMPFRPRVVLAPAPIVGVQGAYGIVVPDESMRPVYRHGQIVFVDPTKPPIEGRGVVVRLTGGRVLVREWMQQDATDILVHAYGPAAFATSIPISEVEDVHPIVATQEAA